MVVVPFWLKVCCQSAGLMLPDSKSSHKRTPAPRARADDARWRAERSPRGSGAWTRERWEQTDRQREECSAATRRERRAPLFTITHPSVELDIRKPGAAECSPNRSAAKASGS